MSLPRIATLWVGSDLSWVERLCLQSWVDAGHEVDLYSDRKVPELPEGVVARDMHGVFAPPFDIGDGDRHRVAVFSDLFRLRLLQDQPVIWADLDAYLVRPLEGLGAHVFGKGTRGNILSGVLALPGHSAALTAMWEFVSAPNPIPPWRGTRFHRLRAAQIDAGDRWSIADLRWGSSGPRAVTHFLRASGEDRHAQPKPVFYPVEREHLALLHAPQVPTAMIETPQTLSVHIFGSQRRILARQNAGLPVPGSYLDRICARHGVDPRAAPIAAELWPDRPREIEARNDTA